MYTKVFRAMYDGTLADNWQALVTFQQLLILANDDGVVDMTIASIHRTTGIPLDILEAGIKVLEAPDHGSRTPDMEGRRISRLNDHRDWGWFLVNFAKYRQMVTREEKKESDRQRIQAKRDAEKVSENNNVAECRELSLVVADSRSESQVSQNVADVAHTDLDTEKRKKSSRPAGAGLVRFQDFWDAYPRKEPRSESERAWRKQNLDAIADVIIAAVKRRIAAGDWRERQYTPMASTYLNQRRWEDQIATQQSGQRTTTAPGATDLDYLMAVGK
jgi:hypothetical protein